MEPARVLNCVSAVVYRNTKDMGDRVKDADGEDLVCKVGDIILGVDAGDGWISVTPEGYATKFLPTSVEGENLFTAGREPAMSQVDPTEDNPNEVVKMRAGSQEVQEGEKRVRRDSWFDFIAEAMS